MRARKTSLAAWKGCGRHRGPGRHGRSRKTPSRPVTVPNGPLILLWAGMGVALLALLAVLITE